MKDLHVAVTGLHAADNPAPGIGVIRSLRYSDNWAGKVIGLAYDVYDTGIYDHDLLDAVYLVPYPNQDIEQIFHRLQYIHETLRIDVLIPTLDSELILYQKLMPRLTELGIHLFLPTQEMVRSRTKSNLPQFCMENDIPTPKTISITDPNRINDALDEIGFPLFVKGVFYEAYQCRTRDEALKYFEKLKSMWGLPVLIQEAFSGEEFDVCVLGNQGEMIGSLPIRKIRLTDKGKAWAAVSIRNKELNKVAEKTIRALNWTGPCELEVLYDSRKKEYALLEINPRFPAWIYLGTGTEQNLPRVLIDLAMGKHVDPIPPAKSGVTFVRHAIDLVCPLEYIESLTVRGELLHNLSGSKSS